MRVALLAVLLALAAAAPAAAATAELLVVGSGAEPFMLEHHRVPLRDVDVRAGGRRCRVAGATPLAMLARMDLPMHVRDYGSCSRSVRDSAGLFVTRIDGDRNEGRDGWVYKIGHAAQSRGAGDPAARVRARKRVTWFWCVSRRSGCQRTLAAAPSARTVAPGSTLRVTVRGYDDRGRGMLVERATVTLATTTGETTATTGADGVAELVVPDTPGRWELYAQRTGMVRSFSEAVTIG